MYKNIFSVDGAYKCLVEIIFNLINTMHLPFFNLGMCQNFIQSKRQLV